MNCQKDVPHTHTYLRLLAGLTVGPVRLIVQLLGHYAQELGLVFVSVVVRGADADQLERYENKTRVGLERRSPG